MKIPTIKGIIDRRMLVNFTIDADVAAKVIPAPFTPKIVEGKAIGGICLIRLKQVRPKGLPAFIGFGSENGAHRFAVEWMENGELKEGVYVPRRDTSSMFNTLAGGRVFPGKHYSAKFDVKEDGVNYHVAFQSSDGTTISVDAKLAEDLGPESIFKDMDAVSAFFKAGSTGFSPNGNKYEGLYLNTYHWQVKPLQVTKVSSSYFENERVFPKGSVHFDNALLMTNVDHEWSSVADKPFCQV
jgi:hypothetical protein